MKMGAFHIVKRITELRSLLDQNLFYRKEVETIGLIATGGLDQQGGITQTLAREAAHLV